MGFDVILLLAAPFIMWLGWAIKVYVDWTRLMWLLIFGTLLFFGIPYFNKFIQHSSLDMNPVYFYALASGIALLVFANFYLLLKKKSYSNDGMKRAVGSLVFTTVTLISILILAMVMVQAGWIHSDDSIVLSWVAEWFFPDGF